MDFIPVKNPAYSDMPMWVAIRGDHSFIITLDFGKYHASTRRRYTTEARPIPGELIYLGTHETLDHAIKACENWKGN